MYLISKIQKVFSLVSIKHSQLIFVLHWVQTEMRSRTLDYYHKQILSVTSAFALTASLVMVMIGGGGVMPAMTTQQQAFAQPAGGETSQTGVEQQQSR